MDCNRNGCDLHLRCQQSARGGAEAIGGAIFEAKGADLTGCEYHPNPMKHRAMADEAITLIKSKTGWL